MNGAQAERGGCVCVGVLFCFGVSGWSVQAVEEWSREEEEENADLDIFQEKCFPSGDSSRHGCRIGLEVDDTPEIEKTVNSQQERRVTGCTYTPTFHTHGIKEKESKRSSSSSLSPWRRLGGEEKRKEKRKEKITGDRKQVNRLKQLRHIRQKCLELANQSTSEKKKRRKWKDCKTAKRRMNWSPPFWRGRRKRRRSETW